MPLLIGCISKIVNQLFTECFESFAHTFEFRARCTDITSIKYLVQKFWCFFGVPNISTNYCTVDKCMSCFI
jgi:hypothetical protein